jgi:hypothetical protein
VQCISDASFVYACTYGFIGWIIYDQEHPPLHAPWLKKKKLYMPLDGFNGDDATLESHHSTFDHWEGDIEHKAR